MTFAQLQPREVFDASFTTVPFQPEAGKIAAKVDTLGSAADWKLHLQAYDGASDSFVDLWAEASFASGSRDFVFTDQLRAFPPAGTFKVYLTATMRFRFEFDSGQPPSPVEIGVFGCISTRQAP